VAKKTVAAPTARKLASGKTARKTKTARRKPVRRKPAKRAPSFLLGDGPALTFGEADYDRARRALLRLDPRLAPIVKKAGKLHFRHLQEGELFSSLVETIISQQLSVRVADVIFGRLRDLCPGDDGATAPFLRDLDLTLMRSAGLSQAKAVSIQDLAAKVCDGTLDLHNMHALPDEEVMRQLCLVKGIGPWSAHIFLIFRLNRPDVWPIGDLGIVRALQRLNGWRTAPSLARLEKAGDAYRPYRSVAAWYLWASLSQPTAATQAQA
jgi:3-methyladenine DNA glycosylase/8-oxoguanine DNA glycosylase